MEDWQKEMLWLSVVYRLAECKEKIPMLTQGTRFEFIDAELGEMYKKDLLEISKDKQSYQLGPKGRELLTRIVAMFDQFLRFEIFADVDLENELPDDILADDGGVMDHCFDPRFKSTPNSTDQRIAMMTYVGKKLTDAGKEGALDPKRIVFLQMLGQGKFSETADDFWFKFRNKEIFKEVEEIVRTAYKWNDLGADEAESLQVCEAMYAAGMLEQRKREGMKCSGCDIPLAIFEANAKADGQELNECPNPDCGASFRQTYESQRGEKYECPQCKSDIYAGQTSCYGCGARVNFSLPEGSVQTETETVTETVDSYDSYYDDYGYGYYYGYAPYGWYDPWDPVIDAMAFGFVCGAILY